MNVKNKKRHWSKNPILILLAIFILFLVIRGMGSQIKVFLNAKRQFAETQKKLDNTNIKYNQLVAELDMLGTKYGEEAKLRQTYPVAKEGENVIVVHRKNFIDEEVTDNAVQLESGPAVKNSLYSWFISLFSSK